MPQDKEDPSTDIEVITSGALTEQALQARISSVGRELSDSLSRVLAAVPGAPHGPQKLAAALGVDKVLSSRVLRAARSTDPLAATHRAPGPEPIRRLLHAAEKKGVNGDVIAGARAAVERFERLIRQEAGDRSSLNAMISAWLPEARAAFETRCKQTAFKVMSQLKGRTARVSLGTVLLHPSEDGEHLDVAWIVGLYGLHRLRPGVGVKFTTRRILPNASTEILPDFSTRMPATLEGEPVEGIQGVRLDQFCDAPPAELDVHRVDDVFHYTLAGDMFGPNSVVDLVLVELNFAELPRYVPRELKRKGYVFSEIDTPAKLLMFDVFVHEDVYPGSEPSLLLYDAALDGVADANDRTRDIDRFDMIETLQLLGRTETALRVPEIPRYVELLNHVFEKLEWERREFRGYRCRIEYPVYGSQVVMAFDPPDPPEKR